MKTKILDGSNIIRKFYMGNRTRFDFALEQQLASLLVQAMSFLREEDCRVEIYFDGGKRDVWHGDELVEVLFSENKKADDLIVNTVADLVENYNQPVEVITQDRELRQRCTAYGAETMSTNRFLVHFSNYLNYQNAAFA